MTRMPRTFQPGRFNATVTGTRPACNIWRHKDQAGSPHSNSEPRAALCPSWSHARGLGIGFRLHAPIPYPFGLERTGYLVTDMDEAVRDAKATGADALVAGFNDPIGRDAIIQWPGGVNTQLYWHTTPPVL